VSNPQPGGPDPCIYIPQEQGGLVMAPDIGFPFRRLLRLAGLRWRYSNRPPRGDKWQDIISSRPRPLPSTFFQFIIHSEMLATSYRITRCHIPKESTDQIQFLTIEFSKQRPSRRTDIACATVSFTIRTICSCECLVTLAARKGKRCC
jgi:hypothetical protein